VAQRTGLPRALVWRYIAWFHRASSAVLVSTPGLKRELADRGIQHTRIWGRGVDLSLFGNHARRFASFARLPRPVLLYVGRIAPEKNIEAFLDAEVAGSKVVIGDGPLLAALKRKYPTVSFLGAIEGEPLASAYASADIFVFPSRTDTFGLTMIEALACGTPVAAYPVQGPVDVLDDTIGCMNEDLATAISEAAGRDRARCAEYGRGFSWSASAAQFEAALVPANPHGRQRLATLRPEPAA
jgi:glycosyltransferase involved in cell wall biosynthesis